MSFSKYAGVAIVPTLARIVLAAVFIPAGWNKVFEKAEFTAEEATQLRALGVVADPAPVKVTAAATFDQWSVPRSSILLDDQSAAIYFARYYTPQDAPADTATPASTPPVREAVPSESQTTQPADAAPTPPIILNPNPQQPLPEGTYTAQALHKLTLMLHANNFPYPVWQARLAAFTELIGGAMLLLGLFSRIWGLGLSIAMGVAFYLVSMKMNGIFTMDPPVFSQEPLRSSIAFLQLSLFVLAFGVLLTGAGPLSLDRMLFGSGDNVDPGDGEID